MAIITSDTQFPHYVKDDENEESKHGGIKDQSQIDQIIETYSWGSISYLRNIIGV